MTDETNQPPQKPPKPPSLRSGSPKDIAHTACERNLNRREAESFGFYLKSLEDNQSSIYQKKRPRQETLNQQMDILDALFTYMSVHADWKPESALSYSVALRAQKQFCSTLKEIKNLKLPKAPAPTPPTFPLDKKIGTYHGPHLDN